MIYVAHVLKPTTATKLNNIFLLLFYSYLYLHEKTKQNVENVNCKFIRQFKLQKQNQSY